MHQVQLAFLIVFLQDQQNAPTFKIWDLLSSHATFHLIFQTISTLIYCFFECFQE